MIGTVYLGRYEVVGALGRGSMGRVFLARQLDRNRLVVLKLMHPHIASDPKFRRLFRHEMQSMARFRHPYAVSLYEGSLDGDPAGPGIIMEYVEGETLEQVRRRDGRLDVERVGRLLTHLCYALDAAHHQGIVHRDLKPANLMVREPGTVLESLKVMDFGLAHLAARPHIPLAKLTGGSVAELVGTPAYMCPEQVRGDELDFRADLYSVGVILFELLTGRLPFDGDRVLEILRAHAEQPPPRFAEVGAADLAPRAVEEVVRACLGKYPADRPSGARELARLFCSAAGLDLEPEPALVPSGDFPANVPKESGAHAGDRPLSRLNVEQSFEAWMPESVAVVKLRGFVEDEGGQLVESVPGLVRVRFLMPPPPPDPKGERKSWMKWLHDLAAKAGAEGASPPPKRPPDPIELELFLEKTDPAQPNRLRLTARFRPVDGFPVRRPDKWKARCEKIAIDLRGYLMAQR